MARYRATQGVSGAFRAEPATHGSAPAAPAGARTEHRGHRTGRAGTPGVRRRPGARRTARTLP
ncbi:hypothetical protein Sgou_49150 [Streptomyces gougerotii]|uniref:Uncharacterized protein n=2 Tax=Streptomyces diastaticus group TaxID=2849069 RepID=A0A8H9HNP7_9ACTN|nr:hypothetical protein Srut_22820 [Streptomyces rutgersensis]GFH70996.1 hypothetical protein Sdia_17640 [Streptomyces diastaticus subsp. diastaticus]GFH80245.1 hypothetical protein Sgou_49150 [Streptomyces gougerotii]GGU33203.1 hypothetical protein GCM10015534_39640 [Streptomyces diastaticus subsp. diastaticus]GGU77903.1 hypothetical protein GCM10010227_35120 [Streptomyces gougerotii]